MVVGQVLDPFNGGSADISFKDWLPSLQRAADWNQWSDAETLIQHLRGRALQEWTLRELLTYISHGILPDDEHKSRRIVLQRPLLAVVGGVLCYVDPKRKNRQRVAVPKSMQQRILEETHSGPFAAHFSGQRMFNTLVTSWWWEHMFEDAVRVAKSCPECAITTGTGRRGKPPLHLIPIGHPFQILGVDVMDLPLTEQGNRHVVVIQDLSLNGPLFFLYQTRKPLGSLDS